MWLHFLRETKFISGYYWAVAEQINTVFRKNFFHLIEVAVGTDFAHEKIFLLTGFAQRKFFLWKSCELDFQVFSGSTLVMPNLPALDK